MKFKKKWREVVSCSFYSSLQYVEKFPPVGQVINLTIGKNIFWSISGQVV